VQRGEFAEALAYIEKTRRLYKNDQPRSWRLEAYVYGRSGQLAQAQKALEKSKQLDQRWQIDIDPSLYVALNRKDEAIALLQRACSEHSSVVTALKVDANYDPLRSDPRFQELLRRVGLAQ
jgi:Flp pilus assembly protein TadD